MEWWRRYRFDNIAKKRAASDKFEDFEEWFSGPWTPEIARKLPWKELIKGPLLGGIDAETRRVIELETMRRTPAYGVITANIMALIAIGISTISLLK